MNRVAAVLAIDGARKPERDDVLAKVLLDRRRQGGQPLRGEAGL
jgi:hypothetical protein